ncbi:hypothetical protein EV03_0074 [Prochlorococcus marinus str. PAC1]|uniref:Uncharacterized protein n=1 Tax=Prochlorococcus marinus str. PAC1 TaxID=59924 RepID=A0A0A2CCV5_PROMR|nr:hypothetical protein EV03_0074 [Prochlorococcus marinus str. PAC1]
MSWGHWPPFLLIQLKKFKQETPLEIPITKGVIKLTRTI